MSDLADAVRTGWGWTGIEPTAVTAISPFGHLIVRDSAGAFWYLDPEVRTLEVVGRNETELFAYMSQSEVREAWEARVLLEAAYQRLGTPGDGCCYSLQPMALLQGDYAHENLCILPVAELIQFAGDAEQQIRALPPGASFQVKVTD